MLENQLYHVYNRGNNRDLMGLRNGTLCRNDLIYQELGLELNSLEAILGIEPTEEEVAYIW